MGIQTSELRIMRRGPQPIELLLEIGSKFLRWQLRILHFEEK
jgi:hypothetical protein